MKTVPNAGAPLFSFKLGCILVPGRIVAGLSVHAFFGSIGLAEERELLRAPTWSSRLVVTIE